MNSEYLQRPNEKFMDWKVRLIVNKIDKVYDIDWTEIVNLLKLDCSGDHLRKTSYGIYEMWKYQQEETIKNVSQEKVEIPNYNNKSSIEIHSDGKQTSSKLIEMSEEESKDVDFLLKKHGFDNRFWELTTAKNNIWNSYSKQDGIQVLYSSKITVKPRKAAFSPEWVKEVLENLDIESPIVDLKPYHINGKILEINLADVHIDKLCSIDETRNEYSTEIGIKRLWQVVNNIIEKTKSYKIEKIIFPFGQDFANIDNMFGTTSRGTQQDTDVKYDVLYKILLKNIINIINKLSDIAPVEVVYVGGNHDKLTSFTMTEAMYWYFLNNENVDVDSIFNNRKYRLLGNTLLGFAHGADEKKNIIYCMQNDVPELWSKAKYREYHLSHFHKEMCVDEKNGIIMRYISSISGTDAWTHNSGYVGSHKKAQAFVYDKNLGLEMIINAPAV